MIWKSRISLVGKSIYSIMEVIFHYLAISDILNFLTMTVNKELPRIQPQLQIQ